MSYLVAQSPLQLALFFMKEEMPLEALPHFREALRCSPKPSLILRFGTILRHQGLLHEEADLYRNAVESLGIWEHTNQRPMHYVCGLRAQPWWDKEVLPPVLALEQCYSVIKAEMCAMLAAKEFEKYASGVVVTGEWKQYLLYNNGKPETEHCAMCPQTVAAIQAIPGATTRSVGEAYFSRLAPGTHFRAHCGPTNARLRVHLGLMVPAPPNTPVIRVCDERRQWEEGKCLVFDDSFEHEVWNYDEERVVLVVDMWHPELDTVEKQVDALQTNLYE